MALTSLLLTLLIASPFTSGERLHYKITWAGLKAGEMTLTVEPMGKTFMITQHTWSTGFVKAFFPMDDTFLSLVDEKPFRSLLFFKSIHEKHRRKEDNTFFLWEEGLSYHKGRLNPLPPGAVDTLASIYFLRLSLDHLPVKLNVHDRGKTTRLVIERAVKERIRVGRRVVTTLRVTPRALDPKDNREAEMTLWFSTAPSHVPLRLKFSAGLGTLTATLDPYCE